MRVVDEPKCGLAEWLQHLGKRMGRVPYTQDSAKCQLLGQGRGQHVDGGEGQSATDKCVFTASRIRCRLNAQLIQYLGRADSARLAGDTMDEHRYALLAEQQRQQGYEVRAPASSVIARDHHWCGKGTVQIIDCAVDRIQHARQFLGSFSLDTIGE